METNENEAQRLCQACGLCCTGHLFIWVKLRPAELDPAEALGMTVFRDDPTQRGFSQPCPLWDGVCTIYTSPHYPRGCRAYTCNLFDEVLAERIPLPQALVQIDRAKGLIGEVEALLPPSSNPNFRERLVACLEAPDGTTPTGPEFREKAEALLEVYKKVFGVKDLLESQGKEAWEDDE